MEFRIANNTALLTLSLPTSNWGLIKNIPSIPSPSNKLPIDLKTSFNEIKDKSATTKFGNSLLLDKRSLGFKSVSYTHLTLPTKVEV